MLELERGLRQYGYRVIRVVDGQTIVIDLNDQGLQEEVRLIGVAAPRYKKTFKEGGGHDAGNYLMELLHGRLIEGEGGTSKKKTVYVQLKFEGWRHGRLIDPKTLRTIKNARFYPAGAVLNREGQIEAYVYLRGHMVNRLMVDSGYARVDMKQDFSHKEDFLRAQERAKRLRVGLWHWNLLD
jgi:endonuclease YncB( thermonuclease family)